MLSSITAGDQNTNCCAHINLMRRVVTNIPCHQQLIQQQQLPVSLEITVSAFKVLYKYEVSVTKNCAC